MNKIRRSPVMTGLLFVLAVVLLFAGTVGGTQAALQVYSTDYLSAFDLDHIGVTLLENGDPVSYRNYGNEAAAGFAEQQDGDLVLNMLGEDSDFLIGKKYDFQINVQNTGTIDQYVRVIVYKHWENEPDASSALKGWFHGNDSKKIKDTKYDLDYITLSYNNEEYNSNKWIRDENASTPEREIYYHVGSLTPNNVVTEEEALFTNLSISTNVAKKYVISEDGIYTYAYDGLGFVVKAEVDAVQTHNAEKAIRSAWGLTDKSIMTQMGIPVSSGS